MNNPRKAFRDLLARPGLILQPVVADPMSALIAQDLGFEALGLGGYAMGAHLGTSEPLLSLEDVAMVTRYITRMCPLPLMVDAGAGYGEPLHAMHSVRTLEHSGASSVHIEDQIYPKRVHYHRGVEHVVDVDEWLIKIEAAAKAKNDPDFVICARTDGMRTDGYEEGIRRAKAVMKVGADAVMMFPNDEAETRNAPRDLPGVPLVYVNSIGNRLKRGVFSARDLEDWGWKVASDAISTTLVTAGALHEHLSTLKRTGEIQLDQGAMIERRKFVEDTIRLDEYYEVELSTVEDRASADAKAV